MGLQIQYILKFIALSSIFGGLYFYAIYESKEDYKNRIEQVSIARMALQKQAVEQKLNEIVSDVLYLATTHSLINLYDNETHLMSSAVGDFKNFILKKSSFDQIRLIELDGKEKIRIDSSSRGAIITPKNLLQDKSKRYYFIDIKKLKRDEVYISRLDLNVENGVVEVPFKPVARVAAPVYNSSGKKIAYLVLNYLAKPVLDRFSREDEILLNSDSHYLKGFYKEEEWGFMFIKRAHLRFEKDFPKAWEQMQKIKHGAYEDNKNLMYYQHIGDMIHVIHFPKAIFNEYEKRRFMDLMPPFATMMFFSLISLYALYFQKKRDIKTEKEMEEMNAYVKREHELFLGGMTVVFKIKNNFGWPVEYVSGNVKRLMGYNPEQFTTNEISYEDILHEKHKKRVNKTVISALSGTAEWTQNEPYSIRHSDGSMVWIRDRVHIERSNFDRVEYFHIYIDDITKITEAEKSIKSSEYELQLLIDTMLFPVFVIDIKNRLIRHMSAVARENYIYKNPKIAGMLACYEIITSEEIDIIGDYKCSIEQMVKTRERVISIYHYKNNNNENHIVEIDSMPLFDKDGNLELVVEIHRDITNYKT